MATAATVPGTVTIDLKQFCAIDKSIRFDAALEPQTYGGSVWATDGRILVRVPAPPGAVDTLTPSQDTSKPGLVTKDGKRFPDVQRHMTMPSDADVANASAWSPWPPRELYRVGYLCGFCDNERAVHAVHCPQCNHPIGEPQPCPYCTGLPIDSPMPKGVKLGDAVIGFPFDELIRKLRGVRWRILPWGSNRIVQFAFEADNAGGVGVGLLVPMTLDPPIPGDKT